MSYAEILEESLAKFDEEKSIMMEVQMELYEFGEALRKFYLSRGVENWGVSGVRMEAPKDHNGIAVMLTMQKPGFGELTLMITGNKLIVSRHPNRDGIQNVTVTDGSENIRSKERAEQALTKMMGDPTAQRLLFMGLKK